MEEGDEKSAATALNGEAEAARSRARDTEELGEARASSPALSPPSPPPLTYLPDADTDAGVEPRLPPPLLR